VTNEHRVEAGGACSSKMATNGAASFVAVPAEIKIEKGWARSEGPRPWHEHPQQKEASDNQDLGTTIARQP
jgi:hypothetical protein